MKRGKEERMDKEEEEKGIKKKRLLELKAREV